MLVWESQGFDLEEIRLTQQAVEVNTQGMSGQLAIQAGTQAPKGMRIIFLDPQLPEQLTIDCLDQLSDGIMQMLIALRDLLLLVGPRDRAQLNAVLRPQFRCFR